MWKIYRRRRCLRRFLSNGGLSRGLSAKMRAVTNGRQAPTDDETRTNRCETSGTKVLRALPDRLKDEI